MQSSMYRTDDGYLVIESGDSEESFSIYDPARRWFATAGGYSGQEKVEAIERMIDQYKRDTAHGADGPYPLRIRVTPNVRNELIIGNNADQIGAVKGDYRKRAFVRDEKAIVIYDRDEHEYITMLVDDHIDRARDWGFEMAWFVRSAERIRRDLLEAHEGEWDTASAPYLNLNLRKKAKGRIT